MGMKIGKEYRFEAAHHLPNHKGKCAQPHGHSYKLEVEVEGEVKYPCSESDSGMVMDFGDLDKIVQRDVIDLLDHQDLNEIGLQAGGAGPCPTAEIIVKNIVNWLRPAFDAPPGYAHPIRHLSRVRLYETEKCYAEWTP